MTESADLDRMEKAIRKAADNCGAMILESILSSDHLPAVGIDGDTFPSLINHLRPRLIYMVATKFVAADEVEVRFENEELDRDLKKLVAKWKANDGQASRLILGLMADGILHGSVETPDWFDEFDIEADELNEARQQAEMDDLARQQEAERAKREADEKKRLAPLVKKLLADPRFNAPKISAAKRLALAEAIFPSEDRLTLRKAVDRATSEVWLAGSNK